MLRLKANKTSLYKLVRSCAPDLCGFKSVEFSKVPRCRDYFLRWTDGGLCCQAFFAASMGRALLSIEKRDFDGRLASRVVHHIAMEDLRKQGMVEESTTTSERRRSEHG